MTGAADESTASQVLSDAQVVLRPWTREDARFLVEASADPAIREYNGDHDRQGRPVPPPSTAQAQAMIAKFREHLDVFTVSGIPTGVVFLIEDAESGDPIGCCGVDSWTGEDVAQIGYWLVPGGRGRGHATRAVVLLTTWLFVLGAARVVLTVVAGNESSAAVARRAGFVHEGTMRSHAVWQGRRRDVLWFAALPSEWPSRTPGRALLT
ncbi:GNAT family N-acetyltransferase [Microlunatus antarcticus]|nr:GNAT family protein [Microlunatus antarcticus]